MRSGEIGPRGSEAPGVAGFLQLRKATSFAVLPVRPVAVEMVAGTLQFLDLSSSLS